MGVTHLALDLGARHQRGDRVDDEHVERARADQHVGDLERLLAGVGLGDQQVVDVDADGLGVDRIHRVLGVDVGAHAAVALGLGDDMGGEGRLPRRLRTEDLDDAAARQTADAEREVEREGARGDGLDTDVTRSPRRMIEPLPNCFSIWPRAMSRALSRSTVPPEHRLGAIAEI